MTAKTENRSVPQLKAGDIVCMYGGRFQIVEDAYTRDHWQAHGCNGTCLEGEVKGYFSPGSTWWFQGNELSSFAVEVGA